MTDADDQVRRCPDCSDASMIVSVLWDQQLSGTPVSTLREYRCQACGARVMEPMILSSLGRLLYGTLFIPILGIGLYLIASELRSLLRWRRATAQPGAAAPERRFPSGPGIRRCSCGALTCVTKVERTTVSGVLVGVEEQHECESCGRTYTFWPPFQMVLWAGFGLAALGGAVAMFIYLSGWWAYTIEAVLALFGLAVLLVIVWSTVDRLRVPVISAQEQLSIQS